MRVFWCSFVTDKLQQTDRPLELLPQRRSAICCADFIERKCLRFPTQEGTYLLQGSRTDIKGSPATCNQHRSQNNYYTPIHIESPP
jgi:hypothetical protein